MQIHPLLENDVNVILTGGQVKKLGSGMSKD